MNITYPALAILLALVVACTGEPFSAGFPDGGSDATGSGASAGSTMDGGADVSSGGMAGTGGNTGGSAGIGGNSGSGGMAGTGGNTGGSAGIGGNSGSGGIAGTGGNTGGSAGIGGNSGSGGMAGTGGNTGGSAGIGGNSGSGGIAGTGGNVGGAGGQGGTGGSPPCETGIYLTVDSQASRGNLGSSAGPVVSTTYVVHGTSVVNKLNATITLVNNLAGDFTMPQSTNALEAVRIRCQDPAGTNSFTVSCDLPLVSGQADCVMPGCHSLVGGTVKMQLQVNPVAAGVARIGIDPTSVTICDDQSTNPVWNVQ